MGYTFGADVVVYSNSFPGVMAACAAADGGAKVAIVSPESRLGGATVNGLMAWDIGRHGTQLNGAQDGEFMDRMGAAIGGKRVLRGEASAAERVLRSMMDRRNVTQFPSTAMAAVTKSGTALTALIDTAGNSYTAPVYVDGFYEADLLRAAGVTMLTGREGVSDYGEDLAGFFPNPQGASGNGLDANGNPFWGLSQPISLNPGDADPIAQQAMCYRVPLTMRAEIKTAVPQPAGYDETLFAYQAQNAETWTASPITTTHCAYGKVDWNFNIPTELTWGWNQMTLAQRAAVATILQNHQQGFLWFCQNSPRVPAYVRALARQYGLCVDEFADNGHWPREPYLRDWARFSGMEMLTHVQIRNAPLGRPDLAAFMSSYPVDCHAMRQIVLPGGLVLSDGVGVLSGISATQRLRLALEPYQVSYFSLLPKPTEVSNVISACAGSWTALVNDSIRMELTGGRAGVAAGTAAAMAALSGTSLANLPVGPATTANTLQARLAALGQVLTYTPPDPLDFDPDDNDDGDDSTGGGAGDDGGYS